MGGMGNPDKTTKHNPYNIGKDSDGELHGSNKRIVDNKGFSTMPKTIGLNRLFLYHTIQTNDKKGGDDKVSPGDEFEKGGDKKKYKIEQGNSIVTYGTHVKFRRTVLLMELF
jgi:hypothetical protein